MGYQGYDDTKIKDKEHQHDEIKPQVDKYTARSFPFSHFRIRYIPLGFQYTLNPQKCS